LRAGLLGSPYRLTEARLLYELAQAAGHGERPGRDLGSTSAISGRLLQGLKRRGLVRARRAAHDGRQSFLTLTPRAPGVIVLDSRSARTDGCDAGALPEHDASAWSVQ